MKIRAAEVAVKAIYTVGSNPVNLVDGNGNATGASLPAGSRWKAFAKKTINGKVYYRLGTNKQWAPADGGSLEGNVADEGSSTTANNGDYYEPLNPDDNTNPENPQVADWRAKLANFAYVNAPIGSHGQPIVKASDILSAHGVELPTGWNAMFGKEGNDPVTEQPYGLGQTYTRNIEIDNDKGEKVAVLPAVFEPSADADTLNEFIC